MSGEDRSNEGLASLAALVQQGVDNRLKELHTTLPGFIDSFDPVTQTCSVQPAIKRVFVDGEALALPVLINVPVSFPTAGGFSITFPVQPGDECTIIFSERSLDNWLKFGDIRPPNDRRFHDLSDGIVLLGLRSNPNALPSYNATELVIRNEANDVNITVSNAGVTINGNLNVEGNIVASGEVTGNGVDLSTHTHGYIGAGTGSSPQESDPPT